MYWRETLPDEKVAKSQISFLLKVELEDARTMNSIIFKSQNFFFLTIFYFKTYSSSDYCHLLRKYEQKFDKM